jgi:hypothetical protein
MCRILSEGLVILPLFDSKYKYLVHQLDSKPMSDAELKAYRRMLAEEEEMAARSSPEELVALKQRHLIRKRELMDQLTNKSTIRIKYRDINDQVR